MPSSNQYGNRGTSWAQSGRLKQARCHHVLKSTYVKTKIVVVSEDMVKGSIRTRDRYEAVQRRDSTLSRTWLGCATWSSTKKMSVCVLGHPLPAQLIRISVSASDDFSNFCTKTVSLLPSFLPKCNQVVVLSWHQVRIEHRASSLPPAAAQPAAPTLAGRINKSIKI